MLLNRRRLLAIERLSVRKAPGVRRSAERLPQRDRALARWAIVAIVIAVTLLLLASSWSGQQATLADGSMVNADSGSPVASDLGEVMTSQETMTANTEPAVDPTETPIPSDPGAGEVAATATLSPDQTPEASIGEPSPSATNEPATVTQEPEPTPEETTSSEASEIAASELREPSVNGRVSAFTLDAAPYSPYDQLVRGRMTIVVNVSGGEAAQWSVTVEMGDFHAEEASAGYIPASNIRITGLGAPYALEGGGAVPLEAIDSLRATLGGPVTVMTAPAGMTDGVYAQDIVFTVLIPGGNRPAVYTTSVVVTVVPGS